MPENITVMIGATMDEAQRAMLVATLRHTRGDKRRTAAILNRSGKTVYNLIERYAIKREEWATEPCPICQMVG